MPGRAEWPTIVGSRPTPGHVGVATTHGKRSADGYPQNAGKPERVRRGPGTLTTRPPWAGPSRAEHRPHDTQRSPGIARILDCPPAVLATSDEKNGNMLNQPRFPVGLTGPRG